MDFNAKLCSKDATDCNFIPNCYCDFSCAEIVVGSSYWDILVTTPSNYFCTAKITEAILNQIKVCDTFIVKFHIEIHLLKDDS